MLIARLGSLTQCRKDIMLNSWTPKSWNSTGILNAEFLNYKNGTERWKRLPVEFLNLE
jgi:hypothetical protein